MQTAAIPYRVADFLKEHPPFQGMEEADLLALAHRGRVKFHEKDEFLCWQNTAYLAYFFVIQQGTVSLWQEADGTERLHDIRGPGDVIGLERFASSEDGGPRWPYSAKATSEVVVYALNAADFGPLLAKHPPAARFVEAQAAVRADYQPPELKRGLHQTYLNEVAQVAAPPSCSMTDSIAQAAAAMLEAGGHSIAVTGGEQLRILTPQDFLRAAAAGTLDSSRPVSSLDPAAPAFAGSDMKLGAAVVTLAKSHAPAIAITSDGTARGQLQKWFDAADLSPAFGDHPMWILGSIHGARTTTALRTLLQRAYAFALENLASPLAVDPVAEFLYEADTAIAARVLALTGADTVDSTWCFGGTVARREHVTPAAPFLLRIGDAAGAGIVHAVCDALVDCGYFLQRQVESETLADWKERYGGWIGNPLAGGLARALPFFDLSPFAGPEQAFADLAQSVLAAVRAAPAFLPLMANDCLANLPPVTFFRDRVVDESGEHEDVFHVEQNVLKPLIDVARVFGIAAGRVLEGSTLERFEFAASLLPAQTLLFRQAADILRVALHQQACIGIRLWTDGVDLPPEWLSHHSRQLLKTGFRTILRLLEFTADFGWMERL